MEKIKKYVEYISLAGAVLVIISLFIPFLRVSFMGFSESSSYFDGTGLRATLVLIFALVGAALILIKQKKLVLVFAALIVVFVLYDVIFVIPNTDGWELVKNYTSYSVGLYGMILGALLMGAFTFLYTEKVTLSLSKKIPFLKKVTKQLEKTAKKVEDKIVK